MIADSEYLNGRLGWIENRTDEPGPDWETHLLDRPLYYAHSLSAWRENGTVTIFAAEMTEGGWDAPYNYGARQLRYQTDDGGQSWDQAVLHRGAGTHQARAIDLDGDGEYEFVDKECFEPKLQRWSRRADPPRQLGSATY